MYDKYDECYARSWAKPGSIYILVVRQSMRTCHAGCAAYPYFLTCLGLVRQRSGDIGASYSSKGIPPYTTISSLIFFKKFRIERKSFSTLIQILSMQSNM